MADGRRPVGPATSSSACSSAPNCSTARPRPRREGIEKYLGSGLVKGIGPVYAKKLVHKFGEKIFDIIENYSARLEEVEGIGPKRRRRIKSAWAEQKIIRDIMVFLHSNGVSTSRAVRIYKTYGENAIERGPRQSLPPGAGHPRHRLPDRRPDRAENRHPASTPCCAPAPAWPTCCWKRPATATARCRWSC